MFFAYREGTIDLDATHPSGGGPESSRRPFQFRRHLFPIQHVVDANAGNPVFLPAIGLASVEPRMFIGGHNYAALRSGGDSVQVRRRPE